MKKILLKINKKISKIREVVLTKISDKLVLSFFIILGFIVYRSLFKSYFEADEWFHFTHYLTLTQNPWGFLVAFARSVTDTQALSEGQHVVPIGEELFFLNTLFLGMNFKFYAFISILLHSVNSFFVFLLIKELLIKIENKQKRLIFAFTGGLFFLLTAIPMHVVTWAAFYGQNSLSVTFFILTILYFKKAFTTQNKKFLYFSFLFLLLDLLTKETAVVLFLLLPLMTIIEKKVFSLKLLSKLFIFSLMIYFSFRFVVPYAYLGIGNIANNIADIYLNSAKQSVSDTETIVSKDLSIHKNITFELLSRSVRFPLKMISELYIPRDTLLSFMKFITPLVYPLPNNMTGAGEQIRSQYYQFFMNGPGNDLFIYIFSFAILITVIWFAIRFWKTKKIAEFNCLIVGMGIIILGSLPLVMIVLSFPRWGYDIYFDSRHYYMPSVGAAILFPFLLIFIGNMVSKLLKNLFRIFIPISLIAILLFTVWLINNMTIIQTNLHTIIELTGSPRREIISQMKSFLPKLSEKTVIYAETDGGGAYGAMLPFQTSFPQILTVIYYDKNPLPDSFFDIFFLDAKPEGYLYSEGRGLGFYNTKRSLAEALLENKFAVDDIHAFYYNSQNIQMKNITQSVRKEMADYLENSKKVINWKNFQDPVTKITFLHPEGSQVESLPAEEVGSGILGKFRLSGIVNGDIQIITVPPTFDLSEFYSLSSKLIELNNVLQKKLYFDKYHFNDSTVATSYGESQYVIKLVDKLFYFKTFDVDKESQNLIEMILGSISTSE